MEQVSKAGEKFTFQGKTLTVKSFFGGTGHEFKTAAEAIANNPKNTLICVKNVEHGGATELSLSIKV